MKLLSIAIPTFNRSNYLKEELKSIITQIGPFKEQVEIVISDNASTDNTGEMVAEVVREYGFPIQYSRVEKGIYFEDNFERAVNMTTGKYVQLTGDDDIMAPCFYDVLLKLISEGFGLIHFNRVEGDVNCCNGRLYDKQFDNTILKCGVKEFVDRVGSGPGFMTSFVFRRDCWDEGLKHKNKMYYGYNFLGQLYQGALHLNAQCCYYYFPLVLQRGNAHGFNREYPLFLYVALPTILSNVDSNIADKWIQKHIANDNKTIARTFSYKEYYREHAGEIASFLTPKQKTIFKFMTSKYTPVFICKIVYKLLIK